MKIKRIRRGCYDKYHRCPGWVGGGFKYPKDKNVVCNGGSLARVINYDSKWWRFKFHLCKSCGTLVLPYYQRWLDPSFVWWRYDGYKNNRMWRER